MPSAAPGSPKTLYDKVFEDHIVHKDGDNHLLYIDRHLVHEVTSPQAFEGLRNAGRKVRRIDCTLSTVDHNIPTTPRTNFKSIGTFIKEEDSRLQCTTLEQNVKDFGVRYFGMDDARQGIVHVVGPEQGFTLPGTTVVCGDSHTSTHGAFGALAFGIGTSEVEHVLATQTIIQTKSKNMLINVTGTLRPGITSKDLVLHIIGHIGTAGGTGMVIEFAGEAIRALTMEGRMSMCNMAIEGGARAGMVAPDEVTYKYMKGRPLAPSGAEWDKAVAYWKTLHSDPGAHFDVTVELKAEDIIPTVTWGTSPQDALPITGKVPDPADYSDPIRRAGITRALEYMGLTPNTPLQDITVDKVFIGSCTNSRIEDLRLAASIVKGKKKADSVLRALVVPGSGLVKTQAEKEGLDKIFEDAGLEWREAGCSMCLGMNPDILDPHERCASTSNRNFEGRQGALSRTHLVSPSMAALAAITGKLSDIREYIVDASPAVSIEVEDDIDYNAEEKEPAYRPDEIEIVEDAPARSAAAADDHEVKDVAPSASTGIPIFRVESGISCTIAKANVDTDAIIPKQFLKTIKRTGLSSGLFYELRYKKNTQTGEMEKTDFALNVEPWNQSKFLVVTGDNFGCGSSREHAPWALADFGIRCIIAPSFGDIFYNNSFKNGLLMIRLPAETIIEKLTPISNAGGQFTVDLNKQEIRTLEGEILIDHFDVEDFRKVCLIDGLDDIGITMQKESFIKEYEAMRSERFSFLESNKDHVIKPVKGSKKSVYGLKTQEW